MRIHARHQEGQATVELVALIPMIVAIVAAVGAVLAAHAAEESAGAAAAAGAAAILQEGDPAAAAKAALARSPGQRATIHVEQRRVVVRVRPGWLPGPLAARLTATATADAGPGPAVTASTTVVRGGDGESSRPDNEDRRTAERGR